MMQKNSTMRKFLIFNLLVIAISLNATAQDKQDSKEIEDTSWKKEYRGIPIIENEFVSNIPKRFDQVLSMILASNPLDMT
jgi:hypothetical protein